jgi:peptide deformylase
LSFPGRQGVVERPKRVKLKAQDRNGKWFFITGEDLLARCICHENDHLNGVVFLDHVKAE